MLLTPNVPVATCDTVASHVELHVLLCTTLPTLCTMTSRPPPKALQKRGSVLELDFGLEMCHADHLIWREKPWFSWL